ncbi:LuxR C-terminal-related transcriptional regulator [Nocardioides zeae]|uniref:LuxR C-terminal-related transcriptional regulator n=1 Tax=Nocardioides imazamoxiresistens TaxID=3231893 RepID=A0ABU3PXY2_9ACTN|nr:LuxR C-terminal-related transcriptional regulator [Nocardioides zeae]MDT9594101.1 LuxR C-terminal-related transcriptional regulator [Nocardioides zeae]
MTRHDVVLVGRPNVALHGLEHLVRSDDRLRHLATLSLADLDVRGADGSLLGAAGIDGHRIGVLVLVEPTPSQVATQLATLAALAPGVPVLVVVREVEACDVASVGAATSCIGSDCAPEAVLSAVAATADAVAVFDRRLGGVAKMAQELDLLSRMATLSARHREILDLVWAGDSNRRIATAMELSEPTVKKCVADILDKLGVENRVQAAVLATRLKLAEYVAGGRLVPAVAPSATAPLVVTSAATVAASAAAFADGRSTGAAVGAVALAELDARPRT